MTDSIRPFQAPERLLLGPGPSQIDPAVLAALAQPTLGHLDPETFRLQDEIAQLLRPIFGTDNEWTLATSGTGSSGMEACIASLIEPGDDVLVSVHGYFGERLVEMARRHGAEVTVVEQEWGQPSDVDVIRRAAGGRSFRLLCAVHAETSTGVLQPLAPLGELARELDALLLVDAVTSLGCVPIDCDASGVDAAYSCTQKGLSCPPGLAPVTLSERARERIQTRGRTSGAWYLDLGLLMQYWSGPRGYHHTASSNSYAALHEAARRACSEGMEARYERHRQHGAAFQAGVEALGLELAVAAEHRLPQLCAVRIPDGIDDGRVRGRLLKEFGIEIGGGLGAFKGRLWRVGLMGYAAQRRNVLTCLAALRSVLAGEGFRAADDPIAAASQCYAD